MSDVLYTHWQLLEWLTIDSLYTNRRIGRQEVTSWSNPTQDFASFFNVVSTILFSLDILFNFRTAYVVSHVPRCAPYPNVPRCMPNAVAAHLLRPTLLNRRQTELPQPKRCSAPTAATCPVG